MQRVTGRAIRRIEGQRRYAYALSDHEDFYDMLAWQERGGYPGAVLWFYDLESGAVQEPFAKRRNVMYGQPVFWEGAFYFLQGDFDRQRITLYRYLPGECPEAVTKLPAGEVELYNLGILGEGIHITSQRDAFACYYPEKFSFPLGPTETVAAIEGGKVYVEAWVEEDWDEEQECPGPNYQFYDRVIVKDFEGRTLSEEVGSLYEGEDGTWWIS